MAQMLCLNNINPIQEIPGKYAKIRGSLLERVRGRNSAASCNEVEEQAHRSIILRSITACLTSAGPPNNEKRKISC